MQINWNHLCSEYMYECRFSLLHLCWTTANDSPYIVFACSIPNPSTVGQNENRVTVYFTLISAQS